MTTPALTSDARRDPGRAPGPRFRMFFGFLSIMRRDPLGFLLHCSRRYGDVVEIRFPPFRNILVTGPSGIRHVLQDNHNPERFSAERSAGRPDYTYFPFGGGPRGCVGRQFALMEGQLILAVVAQRFRLQAVPGHPIEPDPILTLRPRYGGPMTLHWRN